MLLFIRFLCYFVCCCHSFVVGGVFVCVVFTCSEVLTVSSRANWSGYFTDVDALQISISLGLSMSGVSVGSGFSLPRSVITGDSRHC